MGKNEGGRRPRTRAERHARSSWDMVTRAALITVAIAIFNLPAEIEVASAATHGVIVAGRGQREEVALVGNPSSSKPSAAAMGSLAGLRGELHGASHGAEKKLGISFYLKDGVRVACSGDPYCEAQPFIECCPQDPDTN